ncbi:MAG: DUF3048 domain-containing protein [Clostridia bacterium]|nr:DUF3048 domain-containing protein [Clostridia bacterium]
MKRIISVLIAAAMVFTALFSFASCVKVEVEETTEEPTEETTSEAPVTLRDPLTGSADYDEKYENVKPVGIVVENHPQARPQWGFTSPDIVMEYEVEGGISRMLWLYSNADKVPEKVGPVRSARHDVVELAMGMDMLFVHCGGSDIALNLIAKNSSKLSELEAMTHDKCFYRDNTRSVSKEHTLVLTGSSFRDYIAELNINTQLDPAYKNPFVFVSGAARELSGDTCAGVHFEYSNSYKYDFTMNPATGKYSPAINGAPQVDENGVTCAYTNVIILYVDMVDLHDSSGHQDLLLENGGSGLYVCGGRQEPITWTKGAEADRLRLISADGTDLTLNPGNSYIGFVRSTQQERTSVKGN